MFGAVLNEKIGNLLLLMAQKEQPLYLTKALKVLYLIDEIAIKQTGTPVTWQDYQVWKHGPVADEVYNELRFNSNRNVAESSFNLKKYVVVEKIANPVEPQFESFILKPNGDFSDDEFSDYEVGLIEQVIHMCRPLSARELVRKLHEDGTLWDKIVKSEKLQRIFALERGRSNHTINFIELIENDPIKSNAYRAAFESLMMEEELL